MLVNMCASMWIENSSAAMSTAKRSAGVTPGVDLRNLLYAGDEACIHSGFVCQGRHHQKSKTGVSLAPQNGLMPSKNFFKRT